MDEKEKETMAEGRETRPVEPFSRDENPEAWANIAAWEEARADRAEKSLRDALFMLQSFGVSEARIGTDVCRGIDVLATRCRKDINAALAELEVLKDGAAASNRLSDALVESINDPEGRLNTLVWHCDELQNALKSLIYRVDEWKPHSGTDVHEAARFGELILAKVAGNTIPCEACGGSGYVYLPGGPKAICADCGGRGITVKPAPILHACGFCGVPIDKDGNPMVVIPENYRPETLPKAVCQHCAARETEPTHYVTHEMALDAGDPSLEGQPI